MGEGIGFYKHVAPSGARTTASGSKSKILWPSKNGGRNKSPGRRYIKLSTHPLMRMVLTLFRCELLLLLRQLARQCCATQTGNCRADLQDLVRVLGDPQRLFVRFVLGRYRFDFVSVECSGADRNALAADDLQLS